MKKMNNYLFCSLVVILLIAIFLSGCVTQRQNIEKADVNEIFEKDYEQLHIVAEYLLSLDYTTIVIRTSYSPMEVIGDKIEVDNKEAEKAISYLFRNGYLYIARSNTTVYYERWKKASSYEFRAGFAYTTSSNGNINIQYLMKKQELSPDGWYYYEEDYNEWRVNNQ